MQLFARVEKSLKLADKTIKLGLMDEEQRTSLNLRECIREAAERIFFINTGFLDRTGDLLHTQMEAGLFETKAGMKSGAWMQAYEDNNVLVGLQTGLQRCGQIGKGMWAENRNCKGLLQTKRNHPLAGANTAWVPSPTMATLHVLHYHEVDVDKVQQSLSSVKGVDKWRIVNLPLLMRDIKHELTSHLRDYAQSTLGYVVRWVDAGIGCSSVPDLRGTFLMEDRATLRIGSQLLANWLLHGLVNEVDIEAALREMAVKVDEQNKDQAGYQNMAPGFNGLAFVTSRRLVLEGKTAANGYVEPLLHGARRKVLGMED